MGKINDYYCIFLRIYLTKMSCRKCRRWYFREPKFKHYLGEACPQTTRGLGRLRRANFPPAGTFKISCYSANHAPVFYNLWNQCPILKIVIAKGGGKGGGGVQCLYVITLEKGKVLIHHTFLKTSGPHWDVINERSPTISHCSQSPGSDG